MDNAIMIIEGKEVEVCLDQAGHIEGFMINGKPVDMTISNKGSRFIDENIDILMEEAVSVINAWVRTHVMNPAYWGEG